MRYAPGASLRSSPGHPLERAAPRGGAAMAQLRPGTIGPQETGKSSSLRRSPQVEPSGSGCPAMIAPAVVEEIRRLLGEGRLSQRRIAREVGVSRGTVNAIAQGKRPDRPARPLRRVGEVVVPAGPVRRCPECGAMVYTPCLACQVRALGRGPRPNGRQSRLARSGPGRSKQ